MDKSAGARNSTSHTARLVLGEKGDDVLVVIGSGYIADEYDEIEGGMHEMSDLVRTHARKILEV